MTPHPADGARRIHGLLLHRHLVETRYRGMADNGIGNVVDTLLRRHGHHR